jgi:iron-sulfur cluster assembly protein
MMQRQILTVSETAKTRIRELMKGRDMPCLGIRIALKTKGCSGLSYNIEFAYEKNPFDEVVLVDELSIFIDPKAIMFVLGMEMDFVVEKLQSGFVFNNPNEKGKCGCGKSFHV